MLNKIRYGVGGDKILKYYSDFSCFRTHGGIVLSAVPNANYSFRRVAMDGKGTDRDWRLCMEYCGMDAVGFRMNLQYSPKIRHGHGVR